MANLVKELETTWGVSRTPQEDWTRQWDQRPEPEQTEFDVIMLSYGESKIKVIKALRKEILGLGLKEAKFISESVGGLIKEGVCKEEAENLKESLESAGARIEIR